VTRASIGVNLGTVNKAEFKGKSATAGAAQTFSIPVYCSTPTDIRIGFLASPPTLAPAMPWRCPRSTALPAGGDKAELW
jgi:type 1 fimbria pilin